MFGFRELLAAVMILLRLHETTARTVNYAWCPGLGVSVTVSSLVLTPTPRQLEVSWWGASPQADDRVQLYASDPGGGPVEPLVTVSVDADSGYALTGVQGPTTSSGQLGFVAACLGYWVAYVRNGSNVLAASCLRTQPTWMSDARDVIGGMVLRDMFLPGTHDAAAYRSYTAGEEESLATKNAITQEEDILSQLVHGIRYLDMRVAYYKDTSELWWTNHGAVRLAPLKDILAHVKLFVDNTDEVVIFDIHGTTNFGRSYEVHNAFVPWLLAELDGYMVPSSLTWNAALNDVWSSGRRLIVTYNNQTVVVANGNLWTNVQHRWGDVRFVEDLHDYFTSILATSMQLEKAWSAMAELTASTLDGATGALGGLRVMADSVNRNVSMWFRGDWGEGVNIVATDFFRGNTIIQEAIDWNVRRAAGTPCLARPISRKQIH